MVLIGCETASRPFVKYELVKSVERGNGLLGIRIHKIACFNSGTDDQGRNPLDALFIQRNGVNTKASSIYPTYRWNADDGVHNIGAWIEKAARLAGR